jgi:hypothetical protein
MLKTEHMILLTQTWDDGDMVTTITYNVSKLVESDNRIWKPTFTRIYTTRQPTIPERFIDTLWGSYSA